MKYLISGLLMLFLLVIVLTQGVAQTKEWDRTIGTVNNENLTEVLALPDGGVILAGTSRGIINLDKTSTFINKYDTDEYWLVRLDASGQKVWDRTYEYKGNGELYCAVLDKDGTIVLGGLIKEKLADNRDNYRFRVLRIDINGNVISDRGYGTYYWAVLSNILVTSDGGLLLGGSCRPSSVLSPGNTDMYLIKLDAADNVQWEKTLGGDSSDGVSSMSEAADGYMIAGGSASNISGDKSEASRGHADMWIVKIDRSGNKIWDKTIGEDGDDIVRTIIATPDGNHLIGGITGGMSSQGINGANGFYVRKINNSGITLWQAGVENSGFRLDAGLMKIWPTEDGGFMLGGTSNSSSLDQTPSDQQKYGDNYVLIKIDSAGRRLWHRVVGGDFHDAFAGMARTPDGGWVVAGTSMSDLGGDKSEKRKNPSNFSGFTYADKDYWVVKLKSCNGIKIDQDTLPPAFVGEPYVVNLSASGGLPNYTFSRVFNDFPLNVLVSTSGVLSATFGIPEYNGLRYIINARDSLGCTASRLYKVNLAKHPQTIRFDSIPDQQQGQYDYVVNATATSGLQVRFTSNNVQIISQKLYCSNAGEATIVAEQPGSNTWSAAPPVTRKFCINPPQLTINSGAVTDGTRILTTYASTGLQWYMDGELIPGATEQQYKAKESGKYQVRYTVKGCSSLSAEFPVEIDSVPLVVFDPHAKYLQEDGTISQNAQNELSGKPQIIAAADGATRLVVIAKSKKAVRFYLSSPGYGMFAKLQQQNEWKAELVAEPVDGKVVVLYEVPELNQSNGNQSNNEVKARYLYIRAEVVAAPEINSTATVNLVPPPIVLVHGMWSDPIAWQEGGFVKRLSDAKFTNVQLADYSARNYLTFAPDSLESYPGRYAVLSAIQKGLTQYRDSGIAATQADVVAHSLGGLMSKSLMLQPDFATGANFNKGWIHRLVTIGTPHAGSPLGPLLWARKDSSIGILGKKISLADAMAYIKMPIGSCHRDFDPDLSKNEVLRNMGATSMAKVHAIIGNWMPAAAKSYTAMEKLVHIFDDRPLKQVFNGQDSIDLIVSVPSQRGGLAKAYTSYYPTTIHSPLLNKAASGLEDTETAHSGIQA
jgi:pimeloyl-ACP methyl ester carboxylesterase